MTRGVSLSSGRRVGQGQLISAPPGIVENLPTPTEYRSVNLSGNDTGTLTGLIAELSAIVGALRSGGGAKE